MKRSCFIVFVVLASLVTSVTADELKYRVVKLDFRPSIGDGGITDSLQQLLKDNPTSRVVSVAPLQQNGSTVAVVVILEPTGSPITSGLKETRPTKEQFDKLNPVEPLHPRPRPAVVKQQQVRPAIFEENKFGTQNIGNVAYDARWSNYGAYLQRLIETVQVEWEQILANNRTQTTAGTHVTVVFQLDSKGSVPRIDSVKGTAGKAAEDACTKAIVARAPYGKWSEDMIRVLGNSQELAFTFSYQ